MIRRAGKVPQAYQFRDGYGYSNLMFITAGEVIRAVSDMSWDEFVKKHIFNPIGMDRSKTSVTALKGMHNVATPHKPIDGKNTVIPYVNWDNMGAAGGILSSVHDMALWMNVQLNNGIHDNDTLFSQRSQTTFWTPQHSFSVSNRALEIFPGRHFSAYGLGWGIADYGGRKMVSHGGGYDGMYSRVVMVPEENLGIVVLTNSMKGIATWMTYYTLDRYLGLPDKDWSEYGLERQQRYDKSRAKNA